VTHPPSLVTKTCFSAALLQKNIIFFRKKVAQLLFIRFLLQNTHKTKTCFGTKGWGGDIYVENPKGLQPKYPQTG